MGPSLPMAIGVLYKLLNDLGGPDRGKLEVPEPTQVSGEDSDEHVCSI